MVGFRRLDEKSSDGPMGQCEKVLGNRAGAGSDRKKHIVGRCCEVASGQAMAKMIDIYYA